MPRAAVPAEYADEAKALDRFPCCRRGPGKTVVGLHWLDRRLADGRVVTDDEVGILATGIDKHGPLTPASQGNSFLPAKPESRRVEMPPPAIPTVPPLLTSGQGREFPDLGGRLVAVLVESLSHSGHRLVGQRSGIELRARSRRREFRGRDRETTDDPRTSLVHERSEFPLELAIPIADPTSNVLIQLTCAGVMFGNFSATGQIAEGNRDQGAGDHRGKKGPGKVVTEVPKSVGQRHMGKLAAREIAVGPIGHSSGRTQPDVAERCPTPKRRNPARGRDFGEAAEGIRTLDLLHGKQTLQPIALRLCETAARATGKLSTRLVPP
jgi:hypothetical protein